MFDYNPMSSMMMFKALSVSVKPETRIEAAPPRLRPIGLIGSEKRSEKIRAESLLQHVRNALAPIGSKWRQLKLLASRSSLPE